MKFKKTILPIILGLGYGSAVFGGNIEEKTKAFMEKLENMCRQKKNNKSIINIQGNWKNKNRARG